MLKPFLTLAVLIASVFSLHSQETRYSNIQTDLLFGFPVQHDESLKDAIQGPAYGVLLSWNRVDAKNNKFNTLFNHPERGFSFLYNDFNSDILGEGFGLLRHYTYNLTPKRKMDLKLTTAFGLGYVTKRFDPEMNPLNFALGSKLGVSAFLKLEYLQFFERQNLSLNTGVTLTHFSNMSYKNPNLGINTLAAFLGVQYKVDDVEVERAENNYTVDSSLKYRIMFRGGYNQSLLVDSELEPFYTASFGVAKTVNAYSTFVAGAEYINSEFLKAYAEAENIDSRDTSRIGVFGTYELTQNNFAFVTQVGVMVYQPIKYISRVYERLGFQYKLGKHFITEATLRVNLFRAEAGEIGIGYQF